RELGNALLRRLDRCSALIRWAPAELVALEPQADAMAVTMRLPDGERHHRTRLLVGADGSESFVRSASGIGVVRNDYQQCAFVTTVTTERALDGCAFERFTDSGPIALLPLSGQRAGLVLTVAQTDVDAIVALDDAAFIDLVHRRFGYRAGCLSRPGRRKPYPLRGVVADGVIAPRTALVGNAAQTLHPIGAQGFNLGLRDALTLAELLRETGGAQTDCGDVALLRRHAGRRSTDRRQTIAFSDDLVRLMGNPFLPLRALRSLGFLALDRAGPLKRRFALRGMGFRGDAPSLTLSSGTS
ncbi:MAG: FAD-dependent monooxygenase, partial [Rhodanobacteraceae bacterium]